MSGPAGERGAPGNPARRLLALLVSALLTPLAPVAQAGEGAAATHGSTLARIWRGALERLGIERQRPNASPIPDDAAGRLSLPIAGIAEKQPELPVSPAPPPTLRDALDAGLQRDFEALFATPALARAIRENRLAAALVDLTDTGRPRLAMINGDVMIYAASLPKIAILLGLFEAAASGEIELGEATLDKATRMIRRSSNSTATELYYAVGPERLASILQSKRYRLYDPRWGGGLWVGKPYAKRDTWRRDPVANLSHGATAFQVARFFYLLETGRLVSASSAATMKTMLGKPAIRHKFVKGLRNARPESKIFRKSGTWRTYHADAGIVERDGRRYIAVVLANDPAGAGWLSDLIVQFDDLVHGRAIRQASQSGGDASD